MNTLPRYDFIICGAGCAGLSLAMHMIHSGKFGDKKILLIDKDLKRSNDRTWCFWERGESLFEPIVYRHWKTLWFHGEDYSRQLHIHPYQYKMIRGIDFYEYCLETISRHKNFDLVTGQVDAVFSKEQTGVIINGENIFADFVFNSILFEKPALSKNELWLLQHFKGWIIETENDIFDDNAATLMDFRMEQELGAAFCYVLPFNSKRALIEYTLFSESLPEEEEYEKNLRFYVEHILNIRSYKIIEKESGVIPMTNFNFSPSQKNIIHLGTAGGQTKGSSGYTFRFIQKHSEHIVNSLIGRNQPVERKDPGRFRFYDSVFLDVLNRQEIPGKKIFAALFQKNAADKVFKFLDNETSFAEELKIISSFPVLPFFKAGLRQLI